MRKQRDTIKGGSGVMTEKRPYVHVARLYDLIDLPFEYGRYRPIRRTIFRGLSGTVLDAGVGTGRNMPFYPSGTKMVGIDLSPRMLSRARRRRESLGVTADLREMDVTATGFPGASFDYAVATFLFCVLDDEHQLPALRELRRITKPGGEIRILEYAYSSRPLRRFVMHLWAPWVRWMYGATFDRRTEQYVEAAGLEVVEDRFLFEDIIKLLVLRPR